MDQILFSSGSNESRLEAISVFCPQLDIEETTRVYLAFRGEQFLMPPPMPTVVPGATVAVPVTMLMLTTAHDESLDCADAARGEARSIASDSRPMATTGVFMFDPPLVVVVGKPSRGDGPPLGEE